MHSPHRVCAHPPGTLQGTNRVEIRLLYPAFGQSHGRTARIRTEPYPNDLAHRAFFTWDAFRVARRIVADWKPDIISPQNLDEDGWVGWLFARLTGAAFVPQIHIDVFSDHWVRESWLNIPRRLSARFLLGQADLVRAVSHALKRRIMREQHMESSRIGVVPVYVNFQPVPSGNAKALYKNRIAPGLADKPIVLLSAV